MTVKGRERSFTNQVSEAIATATHMAADAAQLAADTLRFATENISSTTTVVGTAAGFVAQQLAEQGTENVGKIVAPIAENPLVKFAAKVPGVNWLLTALGHVDIEQAQQEVDKLRQENPLETPEQLAHRIIIDASLKGGGVGFITNFVPPLAITLFAVDLAAVTTLQAEMVYRIAAAYRFPLQDPARRGEVLAIFGLSVGGSGVLKVGLGFMELLPVIGAFAGASNNATLLYSLGLIACRFYQAKRNSIAQSGVSNASNFAGHN